MKVLPRCKRCNCVTSNNTVLWGKVCHYCEDFLKGRLSFPDVIVESEVYFLGTRGSGMTTVLACLALTDPDFMEKPSK